MLTCRDRNLSCSQSLAAAGGKLLGGVSRNDAPCYFTWRRLAPMPTVMQVISGLSVAAILAAITYVVRLEKRMNTLESIKVQVGETRLPETPETELFRSGAGWRTVAVPVAFDEPFKRQPVVMVALNRFDLNDLRASIHRIGVRADNVGLKGFQLYFETWNESVVYKSQRFLDCNQSVSCCFICHCNLSQVISELNEKFWWWLPWPRRRLQRRS